MGFGMSATLGHRFTAVPFGHTTEPEKFDLCLHLTDLRAAAGVEEKLRALGLWASSDRPDFYGPGGLQISDVSQGLAQTTALALEYTSGVELILSAHSDALYDVFAMSDHKPFALKPMIKHLSDMGCHAADPWPALAVGLNRKMLVNFETHFPDHGLVCVNQAFQRYDLVLTGLGDISIRDFTDFLCMRGHSPFVAFDGLKQGRGFSIEFALSRKAAEQFMADYTLMGLHLRADFVHAQEKVIKTLQVKPGFSKIA